MAIEVRHSASAATTAAAALGGGQAKARQRAALGGAAAGTRLEGQRLGLEARAEAATVGHQRGLERQATAAGFQQEAAVAAQGRRRADTEFALTSRQEFEIGKLDDAIARVQVDRTLTEPERANALGQLKARKNMHELIEQRRKPNARDRLDRNTTVVDGERFSAETGQRVSERRGVNDQKAMAAAVKTASAAARSSEGFDEAVYARVLKDHGLSPAEVSAQSGGADPREAALRAKAKGFIPESQMDAYVAREMAKLTPLPQQPATPGGIPLNRDYINPESEAAVKQALVDFKQTGEMPEGTPRLAAGNKQFGEDRRVDNILRASELKSVLRTGEMSGGRKVGPGGRLAIFDQLESAEQENLAAIGSERRASEASLGEFMLDDTGSGKAPAGRFKNPSDTAAESDVLVSAMEERDALAEKFREFEAVEKEERAKQAAPFGKNATGSSRGFPLVKGQTHAQFERRRRIMDETRKEMDAHDKRIQELREDPNNQSTDALARRRKETVFGAPGAGRRGGTGTVGLKVLAGNAKEARKKIKFNQGPLGSDKGLAKAKEDLAAAEEEIREQELIQAGLDTRLAGRKAKGGR